MEELKIGDKAPIEGGEVTVMAIKEVDGRKLYVCDDYNAYEFQDFNWQYKLTPGGVIRYWLFQRGYINKNNFFNISKEKLEEDFTTLMDALEKQEILKKVD